MRLLVVLVLLAGCAAAPAPQGAGIPPCSAPAEQPATVMGGLPEITLDCLGEGSAVKLSDLRGPLLVNIWAQWCPPCRDEAPYLAALQRKAAGKVQLLGIDYLDPQPAKAIEFAAEHGLAYPHLRDPDKRVQRAFRVAGPPVTVFVDATGRVVFRHAGPFRSAAQLEQLVAAKLGVRV